MREERKKQKASVLSRELFNIKLIQGYTNSNNITMQCDKSDYEMMEAGLNVLLTTPVEYGGAGGNDQLIIKVRDKFNTPWDMTIADAIQLGLEMKRYYWSLWLQKGICYDNIINNYDFITTLVKTKFDELLAVGYDTGLGFIMKCDLSDINQLNNDINNSILPIINIKDINDVEYPMSISEAKVLSQEIRNHYNSLWLRQNTYYRTIVQATDINNIDSIII